MNSVIQFIRSILILAIALGAAGTLVEATGFVGREAVKAHQHVGISFVQIDCSISNVRRY